MNQRNDVRLLGWGLVFALASVPGFAVSETWGAEEVRSLRDLPLAAQLAISAALGEDEAAYHAVAAEGGGLSAANPAQGYEAELTASGFTVAAGEVRWGLALESWGCGAGVEAVAPAVPEASANRVEVRRGALVEWYANGPLGLQQGFTLEAAPPGCGAGEPVDLVLAPVGELEMEVDPDGRGLSVLGADGRVVLRYRGLAAFDAGGQEVPVGLRLRGDRVVVEVAGGASYPVLVDPFVEVAKLTASDGATGDLFGDSVAVSGDTVVVGARGDNAGQGSAYVFVEPVGGWASDTQTAKLTAYDGVAGDRFGESVAVSGDTVVVGAREDDIGANVDQGSAYVFVEPEGGWVSSTETAKLTASDGGGAPFGNFFGGSVAVSGDTVAVGAYRDTVGTRIVQGSAYVFVEPGGGWVSSTETAKLTASDGAVADLFGFSVAVSEDTVVVGARGDNAGQGSAYVFVEPVGGWASDTQTAKLTTSDGGSNDTSGESVAVSGGTVVVGAPRDTIGAKTNQGSAYVFVEPGGGWVSGTETAKLTASDGAAGDLFGGIRSVAVSGDTVVVGALAADIGTKTNQGSAYVFVEPGGGWVSGTETAKHTASDGAAGDLFGSSVALSGDTMLVGARTDRIGPGDIPRSIQGSAYVFQLFSPIELLIRDVEELVSNGTLNAGRGRSLIVKLEAAIKKLQKGKIGGAIGKLMVLIDKVNGFISTGVLTPTEGDALINAANSIIDEILTG